MSSSQQAELLTPEEIAECGALAGTLEQGLGRVLLGQDELVRMVVVACLARGHVLLEGLPGLGKTELVKGLANLMGLGFRRLQFTPDLLPGDVTGGQMLEEGEAGRRLVFHPGPVFTHLLLADEINRASPKTQSALLEAMQERRVTVQGETRELPDPFYVLATQNPIELEGTYPLPEAQLDRFLFKLEVPSVGPEVLAEILTTRRAGKPPELEALFDAAKLDVLFQGVDRVFLPKAVAVYIARLVSATHPSAPSAPDSVRRYVKHGASPRAAIAVAEAGSAHALISGKPNVGFDDVRRVLPHAVAHRMVLDYRARLDGITAKVLVDELISKLSELDEDLPREVVDAS